MKRPRKPVRQAPRTRPSIVDSLLAVPVMAAAVLFGFIALFSLGWAIEHDTPTLAYMGFLIGQLHFVPYRDIFDVNLPGTYFFYTALDTLFGARDLGFRCVDVSLLAALSALTWKMLRPFGWMAAALGPTLFGLYYLHDGPTLCLQREYLMLPLFAVAALFTTRWTRSGPGRRSLGIGVACGLAALIKPQAILILPICLAWLFTEPGGDADRPVRASGKRALRILAGAAAGVAAPILPVVVLLAAAGALDPYVDMAREYYPLYSRLSGIHETMSDAERRTYIMGGLRQVGGFTWWLIPSGLGAFLAFRAQAAGDPRRRAVPLLVALTAMTCLFPAISGQFFPYHWIPFFYFVAALSSLCLSSPTPRIPRPLRAAAIAALAVVALTQTKIAGEVTRQFAGLPYKRHLARRVDAISGYLREHLRAGDTVQPLDWTGGSLDAMWRARAPVATRYLADFYFYHHVSTPYVQSLRRRFMSDLRRARPRVVIEVHTLKPWVRGADTTREFPELREFLDRDYLVDFVGDGFLIHLRRDQG